MPFENTKHDIHTKLVSRMLFNIGYQLLRLYHFNIWRTSVTSTSTVYGDDVSGEITAHVGLRSHYLKSNEYI